MRRWHTSTSGNLPAQLFCRRKGRFMSAAGRRLYYLPGSELEAIGGSDGCRQRKNSKLAAMDGQPTRPGAQFNIVNLDTIAGGSRFGVLREGPVLAGAIMARRLWVVVTVM